MDISLILQNIHLEVSADPTTYLQTFINEVSFKSFFLVVLHFFFHFEFRDYEAISIK